MKDILVVCWRRSKEMPHARSAPICQASAWDRCLDVQKKDEFAALMDENRPVASMEVRPLRLADTLSY